MITALDHLTSLLEEDKHLVWTLEDAVELCRILEAITPTFGAHVALTGGCLYKDGKRKDADILFYRIRQQKVIDEVGLIQKLRDIGFTIIKRSGWVVKAFYHDKPLDLFFPEEAKITIDGGCMDDQYPPGPECPTCKKARRALAPDDKNPSQHEIWIHDNTACLRLFEGNAEGLSFVLKVDPTTDNKYCPSCEKQLFYNVTTNTWSHSDKIKKTEIKTARCVNIVCSEEFFYTDGYDMTTGWCPKCKERNISTQQRDMNPNFIGINAIRNATTVVHGFNALKSPAMCPFKGAVYDGKTDVMVKITSIRNIRSYYEER